MPSFVFIIFADIFFTITPPDYERAEKWLLEASNSGDVYADYDLALLYSNKETSLYNINKSIEYYNKSIDSGIDSALIELGDIYFRGNLSVIIRIIWYITCGDGTPIGDEKFICVDTEEMEISILEERDVSCKNTDL